jgi:hypothetical protein
MAGQTLRSRVPATGAFDRSRTLKVDEIAIGESGVFHVILRPADPSAWKPVNLWKLQLAPAL